jgi:tRNA-splicing ligase RtcB (3'-phosphate/5'-hydroxy nucleic acid ligase)
MPQPSLPDIEAAAGSVARQTAGEPLERRPGRRPTTGIRRAAAEHGNVHDHIYIEPGIKAWVNGVAFEHSAQRQVRNVASLPFIHKHVAIMPDVHWGIGATVGSVIPTKGAVIPAAVGVDIGCGMVAQKLTLRAGQLPDSLSALRAEIENTVPVGLGEHDRPAYANRRMRKLGEIMDKHPKLETMAKDNLVAKASKQMGTLGGGNHFIEVCLDTEDNVWLMLHSGSRGVGNIIGRYFIELAKEDMRVHHINLPDKDLSYLSEGTQHFDDYIEAVGWAQQYAYHNREAMRRLLMRCMEKHLPAFTWEEEAVNCHHNYVAREHHFGENVLVTRKGAVGAREGDLGIIPGSMGARSYIVRGLGNPDSFCSCSHGAGRVMSRGQAKRQINTEQHAAATAGVECRKDEGVLDESPAAYKDIDAVMAAQSDLVEVLHTLKQVLCVKG